MRDISVFKSMLFVLAFGFLCFSQTRARGADNFSYSSAATNTCLKTAKTREDKLNCASHSAGQCMENNQGGNSTAGMNVCLHLGIEDWDKRLNNTYKKALKHERLRDAEEENVKGSRVAALKAMQRAWITYRDSLCDYELAQWGSGSGGSGAANLCLLRETARQTFLLEDRIKWPGN